MPTEENKAIVRRLFYEAFNERNLDVAEELVTPEYTFHDPTHRNLEAGPDGLKSVVERYSEAFPDARFDIDAEQIADENYVVTRYTFRGTHEGPLGELEPTHVEVEVSGIQIDRISEGRIEESWVNWDNAGLVRQISLDYPNYPKSWWPGWPPWK